MAEAAAGIVLGAVTIIVPIYKSYKRCAELLQDILHPTEDLKSFTVKFITQKRFFEMECELLLSSAVGNETAQRMLEEEQHQQWKDQNFIEWCEANVSGPLEMALKTSMETLKEISKRLAQGNSSKGAMTTSSVPSISTGSSNQLQIFIDESRAAKRNAKCRFDWAIAGKSRVKGLLSTLKQQNRDLRRLRKQSSELRRTRGQISLNTPMSFSEAENSPTPDDGTTAEVFAIRDFAECLYEGLALTADCSCHNVNLRLEGMSFHQNAKDNSASRTTFQLVISPGNYHTSPNDVSDCVCLLVQSERRMEGGGAANVLPASAQSTVGSSWKRKASDYFSSDTTNPKRTNQIVRYNIMMNASPLSASNNRMPSTSLNITSLCSALKSAGPRSQSRHCLGFIGNKNMSCQHLLYMEPDFYPSSSRLSLSNLLSASGRQHLPPPSERLRMAPILALSILQFGSFSSSWFQEHWRSRDIFFFLNERISNRCGRAAATSASLSLAPYITSFFGLPKLQPSRRIARNNQLFSLALVLSEIAFGMTLPEIPSPNNIPNFAEDDSILEYLKLKEIVDTKRLEGQVSRKYAKVVEQCFYCDFGLGGDFTKKDLQKAFLRNVVGKLQECVRVLDED